MIVAAMIRASERVVDRAALAGSDHQRPDAGGFARRLLRRHGPYALPWLGLALVLALSSLTFDTAGRAPAQRNWVFGGLNRDHTFGQTFIVERDELVALRILLFANPTARDDTVTLYLRYAGTALPDLAVVTLPVRALAQRDMTTFAIPPLRLDFPPQVVTATLRLDLEAPTLPPGEWITVIAGPDTYRGGVLFVDGQARPAADLAFQSVYRRRWFDVIVPISRLAHGKPGPLGWPQLYALLAYAFGLALARALYQLWRIAMRG
jgi:hypothetical protein